MIINLLWETINSRNLSAGPQIILIYLNDILPIFMPLLLFVYFMIVLLATYLTEMRLKGEGDFFSSFAVAGFLTFGLSIILTFIPGLINIIIPITCLAVAIIGFIALFLSRRNTD